ncbi:MAG: hypothetical protein H6975_06850 [Gammaproteobacteria bacterium]|nr:hypothetical protein [Gammaproteobacteria bacterium]
MLKKIALRGFLWNLHRWSGISVALPDRRAGCSIHSTGTLEEPIFSSLEKYFHEQGHTLSELFPGAGAETCLPALWI